MTESTIERRNLRLAFDAERPRHWHSGNARISRFYDALSMSFPPGEKSFIDSVRDFADGIEDEDLQKDIQGFIRQEADHTREHARYNATLNAQGVDVDFHTSLTAKPVELTRRYLSPKRNLARTVGMEHITAILADTILRRGDMVEKMDPSVRDLWVWHSIEETEHKAVAFDLYQDVDGGYWRRQRTFFTGTAYLIGFSAYFTWQFLKQDGVNRKPLTLAKGLWKMFGYRGVVSGAIPAWFQYLRPDFHPWQDDNTHLLDEWRATLPEPAVSAAA